MTIERIKETLEEAQRFLKKGKALIAALQEETSGSIYGYPKQTGALRRASLDLTRKLAEMRKAWPASD